MVKSTSFDLSKFISRSWLHSTSANFLHNAALSGLKLLVIMCSEVKLNQQEDTGHPKHLPHKLTGHDSSQIP